MRCAPLGGALMQRGGDVRSDALDVLLGSDRLEVGQDRAEPFERAEACSKGTRRAWRRRPLGDTYPTR